MSKQLKKELEGMLKKLMVECVDNSNVTMQNLSHFTNYGQDLRETTDSLLALFHKYASEVIGELAMYKRIFGEIKDPDGEVDVMKAFKSYKEKESFHDNFGRYLEQVKAEQRERLNKEVL